MTHEDYKELLAANALSALDAEDLRALEAHLGDCTDCRFEMSRWEEMAAVVALTANSVEPSPKVRERILGSVRVERANSVRQTSDDGRAATTRSETTSRLLPFEQRPRNVWTSLGSFGAIAAAIAMVAMLVGLLTVWQRNRAAQAELARLRVEMRETNDRLAREKAVVALLTSPGARMMELAGTNVAPGARAMLAYDKTGHAMLMARGLPAAPAGKAYQLWFIKDNQKMPGKVFTTDAGGNGMLEDQIPAVAMSSAVFAITLEPEGGAKAPTGAIYLVSASS
jgi:anti-sigma-K factor RskA